MKMPRSQCESDNIQFVQELAEVDGPFESPININFRDLTKLELPSLIWNRSDTCPKKMKITNTGHTVIISGKWKCERPYLTGGPLAGKYVFSQIHFHWGQDDCRGSEHQVCGDGFPLEMHVAHFKTEYLTQENALREKDGMVVVVYLFKLQEEPNQNLKKIISSLPCVKQPSTSLAIDPRPILSFCNPFTDDYFMYWGSVVTSTCAHILLWIICREPFGISRDQVNEFRKIMDSYQQPICRNNRDIQPLHKRNVFHVNASKHLDNPLLPLKKILGCYCKESGENNASNNPQDCKCQPLKSQEECEGDAVEYMSAKRYSLIGGLKPTSFEVGLPSCFRQNQTYFVQRATVHSVSLLQRFGSEPCRNHRRPESSRQLNPEDNLQSKLVSKSCCFLPVECNNSRTEKRKTRGKRRLNSIRAFSQLMHSLEAIKNHTFKKLKEIESINQEIKGMKSYCQDNEGKQWLRKIEKMIRRQKRFTIRSSQGCLSELKKLTKDCNLDKIFDCKALPVNERNGKLVWVYNDLIKENFCSPNTCLKQCKQESREKEASKHLNIDKSTKFSENAQKLIQSFFEDIQDTDELRETVKKNLKLQKIKSFCSKQAEGDSHSVSRVIKGFITPNMFQSGNLGDRFFTEVSTEDFENGESQWRNINEEGKIRNNNIVLEEITDNYELEKTDIGGIETNRIKIFKFKNEALNDRMNMTAVVSRTSAENNDTDTVGFDIYDFSNEEDSTEILTDIESKTGSKRKQKSRKKSEYFFSNLFAQEKRFAFESTNQKLLLEIKPDYASGWQTRTNSNPRVRCSTSDSSTESRETQRMNITKIRRRQSRRDSSERSSSDPGEKSSTSLNEEKSCKETEGYYIHKKNLKTKKRKKQKDENIIHSGSSNREQSEVKANKWKTLTKEKLKLETEKTSESFVDLAFDNSMISLKEKKLKLECQKGSSRTPRESNKVNPMDDGYREDDVMLITGARLRKDDEVSHSAEENSPNVRRTSVNRWIRASSIDSKTSSVGRKQAEDSYPVLQAEKDTLNVETLKYAKTKSRFRSRSLTGIPKGSKISTEVAQRLYLESLDNRRKNNREVFDLRRHLESPDKTKGRSPTKKDLSYEILTDIYYSEGCQQQQEVFENKGNQDSNTLEHNVEYFKTSSQTGEELLSKDQKDNVQNKVLKRCDVEKYQFLEKRHHELTTSFQEGTEEYPEILDPKSKDASKGGTETVVNKDVQNSVSYLKLKKSSPSKPHSAETLTSLTKTITKKSKKRPHCCKRISRHYIRNSSIFKKSNKTDSKQLNFLNLTNEEQLKIISLNVAKYLTQKLPEDNNGLDPGKTSTENNEETMPTKPKAVHEKKEEKSEKGAGANKEEKTRQNRLPILKSREQKKEKLTSSENNTKTKPLTFPKNEPKNEKPVRALPKPVNNFIKLNKQMAGKYKKKAIPSLEKNLELKLKEKHKTHPERETKEEYGKFKTKIPKKRIEKNHRQNITKKSKSRPETPSSPKSQKQSQMRKEAKFKSLVPTKKSDTKNKKPKALSLPKTVESKQLVESEQNQAEGTLKSFTSQKSPKNKKHFPPANTLRPYLRTPIEIVDNQNRKVNTQLLGMNNLDLDPPDLMNDKSKILTDGNDAVFKKELEYFIKLEMFDISAKIEKSMNYVKSTISQDFGFNFRENTSTDDPMQLDSYNKGIVLLKMKDAECSSSCSEIVDPDKYPDTLGRDLTEGKNNNFNKNNNINTVKVTKESGDSGNISQNIGFEHPVETSDSNYDCKIFITLNTNTNSEGEHQKISEENLQNSEADFERRDRDVYGCQAGNSKSQILNPVDGSSSQSLVAKHNRWMRKENEVSLEMKRKLLEILEGEIRREIGLLCEVSSVNSSEGLTSKGDDSEGNNKSTGSSCDNVEILTQISDTMRQYLTSLKDKGQLVEILKVSSDKEIK